MLRFGLAQVDPCRGGIFICICMCICICNSLDARIVKVWFGSGRSTWCRAATQVAAAQAPGGDLCASGAPTQTHGQPARFIGSVENHLFQMV